jgi:hypothetical protein
MPITTILFKNTTRVGPLYFDGKLRESHNYQLTMTENPLEFGANAVDHAYVQPERVELDVFVGDVWTGLNRASTYNLFQRSSDALARLKQLMIDREPLTIVCQLAQYSNMMLREINVDQDNSTASTLVANLVFQEAIIINDQQESLFVNNDSDSYQEPANTGTQQLQPDNTV